MPRDIFKFSSDTLPTGVNLENVNTIQLSEKRITFGFQSNAIYIDMDTEEAAKNVFEELLKVWAGNVIQPS